MQQKRIFSMKTAVAGTGYAKRFHATPLLIHLQNMAALQICAASPASLNAGQWPSADVRAAGEAMTGNLNLRVALAAGTAHKLPQHAHTKPCPVRNALGSD